MTHGNQSFVTHNRVAAIIPPQVVDGAVVDSLYWDMADCTRAWCFLTVGATDAVIDMAIMQANAASAGTVKALTGAALTQIADTGDNKVYIIEFETAKMDFLNDFRWALMRVTVASTSAGGLISAMAIKPNSRVLLPPTTPNPLVGEVIQLVG